MKQQKIRGIGLALVAGLWAALVLFAWFGPRSDISDAERRPLAQMPEVKVDAILNGSFMADFEDFTLDQFPLRDSFRLVKSLFHYYGLNQADNNDIYVTGGYVVKQEYPLDQGSIDHAAERFNTLYAKYLKDSGSRVFMTVVPDKGYYLAEKNGYLAMDYNSMFTRLQRALPWAEYIDITGELEAEDYYRTDTHWRQEALLEAAGKLCQSMGITAFTQEEMTVTAIDRPFYGVYYGQAALPMQPETMYILENEILSQCKVYDYENSRYIDVYDMTKLQSLDLYDVYLSGAKSLLTIENPNATTDKELIVFRDSFGSSMVPLLVKDYAKVTLVDIRYIPMNMLEQYIAFNGQDVLLLYSTLVLNNSSTIK